MNESEFRAMVDEQTNSDFADMLANTTGYRDLSPEMMDTMREVFKVGWTYAWSRFRNGEAYRRPQRAEG